MTRVLSSHQGKNKVHSRSRASQVCGWVDDQWTLKSIKEGGIVFNHAIVLTDVNIAIQYSEYRIQNTPFFNGFQCPLIIQSIKNLDETRHLCHVMGELPYHTILYDHKVMKHFRHGLWDFK